MLTAGALTAGTAEPIRLDATCLVFTLAVSTITALVFGLVPAWQASRVEPQAALREQSRGGTADRRPSSDAGACSWSPRWRLRSCSWWAPGLLLRTFSSLVRVNLGFRAGRDDHHGALPRRAPA